MNKNQIIIKKYIDEWDPMELLEIGAPNDEYDTEVEMIISQLPSIDHVSQLAKCIQAVFENMFYEDEDIFSIEKCTVIAENILNEIRKVDGRNC